MADEAQAAMQSGYDIVAADYAREFRDELYEKPFDRKMLDWLAEKVNAAGVVLLTFHIGQEIIHRDEWWGKEVSLDFIFFEIEEMKGYLKRAGFELEEVITRDPYAEVEYQSRRAYIFARRP